MGKPTYLLQKGYEVWLCLVRMLIEDGRRLTFRVRYLKIKLGVQRSQKLNKIVLKFAERTFKI